MGVGLGVGGGTVCQCTVIPTMLLHRFIYHWKNFKCFMIALKSKQGLQNKSKDSRNRQVKGSYHLGIHFETLVNTGASMAAW